MLRCIPGVENVIQSYLKLQEIAKGFLFQKKKNTENTAAVENSGAMEK